MATPETSPEKKSPRSRRLMRALTCGLVALAASPWLFVVALESEAAKSVARARLAEAGVEVGWSALTLSLLRAELVLRGLTAQQPGLVATASRVQVRWAWWPLLSGQLHLEAVQVDDLELTSTPTPAASPPPTAPSTPRSALLEGLSLPLRLDALRVAPLELHVVDEGGALHLTKLSLEGRVEPAAADLPSLVLTLRGGAVERTHRDGPLRAALVAEVTAALKARVVTLAARVRVDALEPSLPLPSAEGALLARAELMPEAARIDLELTQLSAFGGALEANFRGTLADDRVLPAIATGHARLDADPLAALLTHLVPGLQLRGAKLEFEAQPLQGDTAAALRGTVVASRVDFSGVEAHGLAVTLEGRTSLRAHHATVVTTLDRLDWADGAQRALAERVVVKASIEELTSSLQSARLTASLSMAAALAQQGAATQTFGPVNLDATGTLADGRLTAHLAGPLGAARHTETGRTVSVGAARLEADAADVTPTLVLASATGRFEVDDVRLAQSGRVARVAGGVLRLESLRGLPSRPAGAVGLTARGVTVTWGGAETTLAHLGAGFEFGVKGATLERLTGAIRTSDLRHRPSADAAALRLGDGALNVTGRALSLRGGQLELHGAMPPLRLDTTVDLEASRLHAVLRARVDALGPLALLLPVELAGVQLEPALTSLAADVDLRVADVQAPERGVWGVVNLHLEKLTGRRDGQALAADGLDVSTTLQREAGTDTLSSRVTLRRPRIDDVALPGDVDARLDGALAASRGTGRLKLVVRAADAAVLDSTLTLRTTSGGRLHHTLSFDARQLGPLAPFVSALSPGPLGLELETLGVHLESEGDTVGLVDARLQPLPHWAAESDTNLSGTLTVTDLVHHTAGERLSLPRLQLVLDAGVLHGALSVTSSVESPRVDLDLGDQHATFIGLHQSLTLRADERDVGLMRLTLSGGLDELDQSFAPAWRPRAVRLEAEARIDALSSVNVDRFVMSSPLAGTQLELTKRLRTETGPRRGASAEEAGGQRFLLEGRLTQDLAKLDGQPAVFRGRGQLAMPFVVDSADHSLFRLRGALEFDAVDVTLPGARVEVKGLAGQVPLEQAVTFDPLRGLVLVPSTQRDVFARARSQNLSGEGQVALVRLRVGDFELAPVVARLELGRNRFSLNEVKAERGSARLAGQLFVDYLPGNEAVTFRGALTGLSGVAGGEPLDANAALVFRPARLELDGRVQVVRMSRAHLVDLMNLLDPHREQSSLNRVRSAVDYGYPRQAQLSLGDGLLSMDVEFGGLAGLFDLGPVRGVSLGPLLNRYLAPYFSERTKP